MLIFYIFCIFSKMIIQEELSATLDEPTDCLIMHRVEPSRLQLLALNLADKLNQLIDNNEQVIFLKYFLLFYQILDYGTKNWSSWLYWTWQLVCSTRRSGSTRR